MTHTPHRAARVVAIVILIGFVLLGLVRLSNGVGMLMALGGDVAIDQLGAVASAFRTYLADLNRNAFIQLSAEAYFQYIAAMGVVLLVGAALALFRKRIGLHLIALYVAMHGFLFVNYQTLNAKPVLFLIALAGIVYLYWADRTARRTV